MLKKKELKASNTFKYKRIYFNNVYFKLRFNYLEFEQKVLIKTYIVC